MKKLTVFLLALCFSFILLPFCATAQNDSLNDTIEESFYEGLDSELSDMLEAFDISGFNGQEIFTKGTENIKLYFSETLENKLKSAAGWFFLQLSIIMLLSAFGSAFDFSLNNEAFTVITAVVLTVGTFGRLSDFLNCTVAAMNLNGRFMLAFIPVFALLISLSGNPASALTYNSMVLLFCEVLSYLSNEILVSLTGIYFALTISFFFNPSVNLSRFTGAVNKASSVAMGFIASMFTGTLTLKNVLAYSTDSLSVKGIRFLIGSLIPVIGPSISDAYSSVLGSINLMKSSLAVIGILALVIINIPPMVEGAVYFFLLTVLGVFADMLGASRAAEIMRSFSGCVKILLLICLFQFFILIISIGIMLTVRGGLNG